MKFILVRHRTTDWNLIHRIQGHTDIELNDQGRKEAEVLANEMILFGVSSIVSSDLKRALQTAEIIKAKLQVPLYSRKELRECSFGDIEGLKREEAVEKYGPEILQNWNDQYLEYDFRPYGGENKDDVITRHLNLLKECSIINKEGNSNSVLLVGHGRGFKTLLSTLGYSPTLQRGE